MAFAEDHGTEMVKISGQEFFNSKILKSGGLAHIAENIFDQLDGKTLANCEEVSPVWRKFIVNYELWKRQYFYKLAKPGSDAYRQIKSNLKLFQADLQADQGKFFERSGGGNCEAISDGAVASSKVFDVHLDFAYSSDYSSFQRGHVISNKNYNNLHVFSFDITSPKIVIFQLSLYFSRFFFLANQKRLGGILAPQYFGTVVFWHRGILALWNFGTTVKRHLLKT
jgi:hypothetical protein